MDAQAPSLEPSGATRPGGRLAPLALVLALLATAVAIVGAHWAVDRIDEVALQEERAQVLATLDEYRERLRVATVSELHWDEAVRNIDLDFDPAWVDSAIGEWLASSQGIEWVVVYDRDDRPIHASIGGQRTDPATLACEDGPQLARLRAREAARGPLPAPSPRFDVQLGEPISEAAFARCRGEALLVVATLVQPDFGRVLPAGPRSPVVVAKKRLDEAVVGQIARSLLLDAMRFEPPGAQPANAALVELVAPAGLEVARLAWRPGRPGRALLAEAAPSAAFGLAGLLLVALVGARRVRIAQAEAREAATRAQRHAASLERMSALSRIGAWETGAEGRDIMLTRECSRILGIDRPGTHPLAVVVDRLGAEWGSRFEASLGDCLRFGAAFELTFEGPPKQRSLRVRGRISATGPERVVEGTLQDITEQVEQQRAQRRNTELLERMSRLANIGGWEYDVRTRTLTLTDQAYRIYGFAPGTPVSVDDIAALYAPDDARQILDTVGRAARDGTPWELDLNPTTVDGRGLRVRGLGEAEAVNGRVLRLFGTLQDTTEAHRAAARLQEAMQQVADRNAEIEQFTFAASHDLQEPVRKVQALGSLLLARHGAQLDETGQDCVRRMQRSCERMSVLVDDVLAYSRVALRPVQRQTVDLDATLGAVVEDLGSLIDESGGRLDAGPLGTAEGDPLLIRRLLQNLLANAFRHSRHERALVVKVSATTSWQQPGLARCRLVVEDNGTGFDPRHAESIFLPFVRLQRDERGDAADGSGIGLSIVRRIAQAHGGSVAAEGRPGVGARFIVELPRGRADASQPGASATA